MRKDRHLNLLRLLCAGLAALVLTGCMGEQEQWLQGSWSAGNVHYFAGWYFDEGVYSYSYDYTTIGTANMYETGRYAVKESGEDYIVLELFNRTGSDPARLEENERIRIEINFDEDSIHFKDGTYVRVTESTLEAIQTSQAP